MGDASAAAGAVLVSGCICPGRGDPNELGFSDATLHLRNGVAGWQTRELCIRLASELGARALAQRRLLACATSGSCETQKCLTRPWTLSAILVLVLGVVTVRAVCTPARRVAVPVQRDVNAVADTT